MAYDAELNEEMEGGKKSIPKVQFGVNAKNFQHVEKIISS